MKYEFNLLEVKIMTSRKNVSEGICENVPIDVPLNILNYLVNDKKQNVGDGNYIFYKNDDQDAIEFDKEIFDKKLVDVLKGYEDEPLTYEFRCYPIGSIFECFTRQNSCECDKH